MCFVLFGVRKYLCLYYYRWTYLQEALESVMCDVIKIRLKSGKGNQPLKFKIVVRRPILKLGLPNFYFTSRCIPPFQLYVYDVTHDTFQRFTYKLFIATKNTLKIDSKIFSNLFWFHP